MNILSPESLQRAGPHGQVKLIERALWHLRFDDVRVVDGSGDSGADILAVRANEQWVFQSKWSKKKPIGKEGVDDLERAHRAYGADRAVLITNTSLGRSAEGRLEMLKRLGLRFRVWNGATLNELGRKLHAESTNRRSLRAYQAEAAEAITQDLATRQRGLLILATGLGKTVIAGEVIANWLSDAPGANVLIVSHLKELAEQLERAMWHHLRPDISTHLLTGDSQPPILNGVTSATVESALGRVLEGYSPDLLVVDETHHVGETGMYSELFEALDDVPRFGVTATPWRGDKFDITQSFGAPSFQMDIAEGIRRGWLSQVDYRLFVDNVNWEYVQSASKNQYSIRELNKELFLPQRDDEIVDIVWKAWTDIVEPRAILFCQTIEHAEHIAALLRSYHSTWSNTTALHSGLSKQEREVTLNRFRLGRTQVLTCVDVLNEGVDVPNVNLVGFLRVTHSRRIFVQQLGRGLRLAEGKTTLRVLDFVTDIRRVAAALQLKREMEHGEKETVTVSNPNKAGFHFSDATAGEFLDMWIADAANLETSADEVYLQFPEAHGPF